MSGAEPAQRWSVSLSDVRLSPQAVAAARETLESGWLSGGPRVAEFERAFAEYVGCRHAIACSSGTAALHLGYGALGVGPGDEVVMPALNFVAAANVAVLCGARPVFADIVSEDDLTLDPESVARLIGPRTRAIVAMHYGGHPCSERVFEVGRRAGIPVIEDAAHAPGAELGGVRCGALGAAGCFSFYANKNLPLGEGGMLTTGDDAIAERARLLRSHGMSSTTWDRHRGSEPSYDVRLPGFNLRLDDPRAAMGTVLLRGLDAENANRARAVEHYRRLLGATDTRVAFGARPAGEASAHHLCTVVLAASHDRDAVRQAMAAAGVQTSVHYPPIHHMSAFAAYDADVPVTDSVAPRLLTLPLYGHLGSAQVEAVVAALVAAIASAPQRARS